MKATRLTNHELEDLRHQFETDTLIRHCKRQIQDILKNAMPIRIRTQGGKTTSVYSEEVEKMLAGWKSEIQSIINSKYSALFEGTPPISPKQSA